MGFRRRVTEWFDHRRRVVIGALGAWVLVAVASAGRSPRDSGWVGVPDLSAVLIVAFAAFASFSLVIYIALLRGDRAPSEQARRRPTNYWRVALVFLAILIVLRSLSDDADDNEALDLLTPDVGTEAVPEAPPPPAEQPTRPVARAEIVGAAALAGMAAAVWWSLRRGDPAAARPPEPAPTIGPAIDQAIADLDLGADPRRAILAAYASLERALADGGIPRVANETAVEHLSRALGSLPVDHVELRELGLLYERARFSRDALSIADRDRARTILDAARTSIRLAEADRSELHR